jgi:hypothetical protein
MMMKTITLILFHLFINIARKLTHMEVYQFMTIFHQKVIDKIFTHLLISLQLLKIGEKNKIKMKIQVIVKFLCQTNNH